MTARTSSINGVTRLREFEIDITKFERHGYSRMQSSAEASDLGLKPGEWPDWFTLPVIGTFRLHDVDKDGSHIYTTDSGDQFVIFND
jgi:hypothetical protein